MIQDLDSGLKRLKHSSKPTTSQNNVPGVSLKQKVENSRFASGKASVYSVHPREAYPKVNHPNNRIGHRQVQDHSRVVHKQEKSRSDVNCITSHNANTSRGLYRDYNEDRVDIITNILVFDESTK